ncbi:MAG: hypothetical protein LBJ72_12600 [Dysgonamonadaceae bacterium]|jgi:hypothetical protein|nr:hypothetical protein [Dysgonamonadaceae bacterium]
MKNVGIQLNRDYNLAVKVKKDESGKITSGLIIGDVTHQNQAIILTAQKGELKESPTVGTGINDICNDNDFRLWKREITEQIEGDGQRITRLVVNEKELILDAKYI